jgi:hypothetical protein
MPLNRDGVPVGPLDEQATYAMERAAARIAALEAACQRLEWAAAEAEALTMTYESRITRALAALDAGDLSNARRALEGKPDA